MRLALMVLTMGLLTGGATAQAAGRPLDCAKKSLADAVRHIGAKRPITFTGVCGPITILADGVTLVGVDVAAIDGGGTDAVTIEGASRVSLTGIDVRNGLNGIVVTRGAHATLSGVSVHANSGAGIAVRASSTVVGTGIGVSANGGSGVVGDDGASIALSGGTLAGNGAKDLQLTFGSRVDVNGTSIGTYSCDSTILTRGTAALTCPH